MKWQSIHSALLNTHAHDDETNVKTEGMMIFLSAFQSLQVTAFADQKLNLEEPLNQSIV